MTPTRAMPRNLLSSPSRASGSPERFGSLVVEKRLGRGMIGEVFLTHDERGRKYVVKRLRPQMRGRLDLARFAREADLMRRIAHENLMPAVHVDTRSDPPYFVMPFREGRTVAERLAEEGRLDPALVARIGCDVCSGLQEAHRHGIVHRDLKPENLLLELSGRTVILDFGLARLLEPAEALTAEGTLVGTPAYMAPEVCHGEPAGPASDIYGLGVTLVELILGKNPFAGPDVAETLNRHLSLVPRRLDALLPHRIPHDLGELLGRMLAKNPDQRPGTASCAAGFASVCEELDQKSRLPTRAQPRLALN